MRRILSISCLMVLSLLIVSTSFAESKALEKAKRGIVNIVTSPVEIPKQFRAYWIKGSEKTPHILVWLLSGTVKGAVNMVGRFGSGAWDVVTSPCPKSQDKDPLMKPNYVFDEWPTREQELK